MLVSERRCFSFQNSDRCLLWSECAKRSLILEFRSGALLIMKLIREAIEIFRNYEVNKCF